MTKCNDSLNDEQRKIVENNHDLIYGYAHKMGISIDEYYDILAIGLCKAAKAFDESKGRFSTLAYCCMKNEMCRYYEGKTELPHNLAISLLGVCVYICVCVCVYPREMKIFIYTKTCTYSQQHYPYNEMLFI